MLSVDNVGVARRRNVEMAPPRVPSAPKLSESLACETTYDEPEVILLVVLSEMNNQSLILKQLTRWTQPKISGPVEW